MEVVMKGKNSFRLALVLLLVFSGGLQAEESQEVNQITEALTNGVVYGDFRLRFETVDQDNALRDAEALTLRSRLGYNTGVFNGFSATVEMEDSRIVGGVDSYSVGPTGFNPGEYSVIADPETTELDQAYIQYKNAMVTVKWGRQALNYDGQRFIGDVGWRQDRQTFDAFSVEAIPVKDLTLKYAYVTQRLSIFAKDVDIDSQDHLFNASYVTPVGTVTAYAYLLEVEPGVENGLDTYGVSLKGTLAAKEKLAFPYALEYATQNYKSGATEYDSDYYLIEAGATVTGITASLGYEVLGSDDGAYGFATPLATLHKFNGWADLFLKTPTQGLVDRYISVKGPLAGGAWAVIYHEFEADDGSGAVNDMGSEWNLVYSKQFGQHYSAGIKYAAYDAGDINVDTEKLWLWVGFTF